MFAEEPKRLSPALKISCYCCEDQKAEYRCRFKLGELMVQICLCSICINYDEPYLFENTVGLSYPDSVSG
jgi:hypothetical protein